MQENLIGLIAELRSGPGEELSLRGLLECVEPGQCARQLDFGPGGRDPIDRHETCLAASKSRLHDQVSDCARDWIYHHALQVATHPVGTGHTTADLKLRTLAHHIVSASVAIYSHAARVRASASLPGTAGDGRLRAHR